MKDEEELISHGPGNCLPDEQPDAASSRESQES